MSLHINKFVDRIKAAESRQLREVALSINEARDLHADITKLLLALDAYRAVTPTQKTSSTTTTPTDLEIDGGSF